MSIVVLDLLPFVFVCSVFGFIANCFCQIESMCRVTQMMEVFFSRVKKIVVMDKCCPVINISPQTKFVGDILESLCPSVCPYVRPCFTKSCPGHNFKSIKASNFKLHTQIGHIVEKCSVQEP